MEEKKDEKKEGTKYLGAQLKVNTIQYGWKDMAAGSLDDGQQVT